MYIQNVAKALAGTALWRCLLFAPFLPRAGGRGDRGDVTHCRITAWESGGDFGGPRRKRHRAKAFARSLLLSLGCSPVVGFGGAGYAQAIGFIRLHFGILLTKARECRPRRAHWGRSAAPRTRFCDPAGVDRMRIAIFAVIPVALGEPGLTAVIPSGMAASKQLLHLFSHATIAAVSELTLSGNPQ